MNTLETPQVQKLRERAAELDAAIKTAGMDIEIAQRGLRFVGTFDPICSGERAVI